MANRRYCNLANDKADILNEQNEAYVEVSGNNAENTERISGYDEIFDAPVITDYECPLCMTVSRDLVQTPGGHLFCRECIHRHMEVNGCRCPIDNQEVHPNLIYADNFAKREVNQLRVKCRTLKNKKECPWTGPLQNIEEHLTTCEFVEVPCPKGCNQNVERKCMEHHLKNECSKRTVTCQCCKTEMQHKNLKNHMGKCQKVVVACSNCNQKMLREKLTAGHKKECPLSQACCDFKAYGCNWTGLKVNYQSHLTCEASIASHLSMLSNALASLVPGHRRDITNNGAPRSDVNVGASTSRSSGNGAARGNVLEESDCARNRYAESIANLKAKIERIERSHRDLAGRLERQQRENEASITFVLNRLIELLPRMCNGVYLWKITGYARHLENARNKDVTALYSSPFYTNFYGYKLCLRLNPTGVEPPALDPEESSHVSLFVHMMQSDWDDTLEWPFSGRISLSILDQSDDGEYKRHISKTLVTTPDLLAFQRPTTPLSHKSYGYVEFTQIVTLEDRKYVKNDCLLVRVQVFQ